MLLHSQKQKIKGNFKIIHNQRKRASFSETAKTTNNESKLSANVQEQNPNRSKPKASGLVEGRGLGNEFQFVKKVHKSSHILSRQAQKPETLSKTLVPLLDRSSGGCVQKNKQRLGLDSTHSSWHLKWPMNRKIEGRHSDKPKLNHSAKQLLGEHKVTLLRK